MSGSDVALVSAADKLHNAGSVLADYLAIDEEVFERFNKKAGRRGTLWHYRRLAQILPARLDGEASGLGTRLVRTVDELFGEVYERNGRKQIEREYTKARKRERAIRAELP